MPRDRKTDRALPVGLFILLALVILISSIFWIRAAIIRPVMTFTVIYPEPPSGQVSSGIPVYYRGIRIGNVRNVSLANDEHSMLVEVGITDETVKLPDNVRIFIETEGITGQRFISVRPARPRRDPPATDYIKDQELVLGQTTLTWEQVQERMNYIIEERLIEKNLAAVEGAMRDFQRAARRMDGFLANAEPEVRRTVRQFDETGASWELASHEVRETAASIRERTAGVEPAIQQVGRASSNIADTFGDIQSQLRETNLIPEMAGTVTEIRSSTQEVTTAVRGVTADLGTGISNVNEAVSGITEDVRGVRGTPGLPTMPPVPGQGAQPGVARPRSGLADIILQARETTARANCISREVSNILAQRFLGFRLFFGRVGGKYDCEELNRSTSQSGLQH